MMRSLVSGTRSQRHVAFVTVATLAVLLGSRTAYYCTRYFGGAPGTKRFQLEATTFWFIIVCFVAIGLHQSAPADVTTEPHHRGTHRIVWLCCVLIGAALYWPAMRIGLLSDDFVLAERAYRFSFGAFNTEAFRPLPLVAWSALLHIGGGPVTLHALNIVLHGTNAYLTMRVATPLLRSRRAGFMAAAMMITMPISVEPVAWCSGVFDLMATAFIALSVLAARQYETGGTAARVRLLGYVGAGLLSKETAAVTPIIILIDSWARRTLPQRLYRDLCGLFAVMAVLGAVRLAFASPGVRQPLSKYVLQRWVFGTVGALAVPWHADLIHSRPWLAIGTTWILVALLTSFVFRKGEGSYSRVLLSMSMWILVGTAPTLTFFYVGSDLQNSRYVYFSTIGWAAALVAIATATGVRPLQTLIAATAMVTLPLLGIYGIRQHLIPWTAAAEVRMSFEREAARDKRLLACQIIAIRNPPDSIRGAYVLRNGSVAALKRDLGFDGEEGAAESECTFRWDTSTETLRPLR